MAKKIEYPTEFIDEIQKRLDDNMSMADIANNLDSYPSTIERLVKEHNLTRHKICKLCGKPFTTNKMAIYTCSDKHFRKCPICGKEFEVSLANIDKVTCSMECKQRYIVQSGIGKKRTKKSMNTKLLKYGTLDGSEISKEKIPKRICPLCNKEFQPDTFRQVYCKDKHYGECPVCGKRVEIRDHNVPVPCCSRECQSKKTRETCLEKYDCTTSVNSEYCREKAKRTNLAKYGVDNPFKNKEFRDSIWNSYEEQTGYRNPMQNPTVRKKSMETCMSRYGYPHASQSPEMQERIKMSNLERYGTAHPMQNADIQARVRATNRSKYGVDYITQIPGFSDRVKQTCLEKYGYDNYMKSQEGLSVMITDPTKVDNYFKFKKDPEKWIDDHYNYTPGIYELCDALGVTDTSIYNILIDNHIQHRINHTKMSSIELNFLYEYFDPSEITYNNRRVIPPLEIDIYIPKLKLGIECNPTVTHNSSFPDPWGGLSRKLLAIIK